MVALALCAGGMLASRWLPAAAAGRPGAEGPAGLTDRASHLAVGVRSPSGPAPVAVPGVSLAKGACIAFPPVNGDRGRTVFVDPGHGGPDPGTAGPDSSGRMILEKDAALAVALDLADRLRASGYRVVLARTTDTLVTSVGEDDFDAGALRGSALHRDLLARIACANAAHADALLSIHFNAFEDSSVGGAETIYDPDRPFAASSQRLAGALQAALVSTLGVEDRGLILDTDLDAGAVTESGDAYGHLVELGPALSGWVDRPSAMPGALVEPLFLTTVGEADVAGSASGRDKIAGALAAGVVAYLAAGRGYG